MVFLLPSLKHRIPSGASAFRHPSHKQFTAFQASHRISSPQAAHRVSSHTSILSHKRRTSGALRFESQAAPSTSGALTSGAPHSTSDVRAAHAFRVTKRRTSERCTAFHERRSERCTHSESHGMRMRLRLRMNHMGWDEDEAAAAYEAGTRAAEDGPAAEAAAPAAEAAAAEAAAAATILA